MPVSIIISILALAGATGVALWAVDANRRRLRQLGRARAMAGVGQASPIVMLGPPTRRLDRAAVRLQPLLPEPLRSEGTLRQLERAGFDSPGAVILWALLRLLTVAVATVAAMSWAPRTSTPVHLTVVAGGILLGLAVPPLLLRSLVRRRQDQIRRAVPDALDLLLVCVEAGVSLDTALLRVGREMQRLHPGLAEELLEVNRVTSAGLRRDEALYNMYARTGVREIRALVSTLVQSERWGTSIATVLRVYADSMRLKRRQAAEKRAAVVATKMVFPLALLILPALFIVVAGPVILGWGPILDILTQPR